MVDNTRKRSRLMIDVSPDLRRRVKVAAAQRDVSLNQYVADILEAAVAYEEPSVSQESGVIVAEAVERLNRTRKAVMRGRVFADDSAELIEQGRSERTAELTQAAGP